MKFLKYTLITIAALAIILGLTGFLLPSSVHVQRQIMIKADAQTVYTLLNSYQRFNEWSPWYGLDPNAKYTLEGPAEGVGAKMVWVSQDPSVGSGSQDITESVMPSLIRTHLYFEGQGDAYAAFRIDPVEGGTQVTWEFNTEFGNDVVGRWFGVLMFDSLIGADYEKGLSKLKQVLEK